MWTLQAQLADASRGGGTGKKPRLRLSGLAPSLLMPRLTHPLNGGEGRGAGRPGDRVDSVR